MADNWESVPLGQLVEADRGISYGIVQPGHYVCGGVPIVRVTDIRDGRIETFNPLRVSAQIEASHARTRLRGGELLLTLVGTVGETAVVPDSLVGWNVARAVGVIPVRQEIGSYWVQLALQTPAARAQIEERVNTTVQVTLNLRDVAQLAINLPPPQQRERIEYILRMLDVKMDLNRRMNETLVAIAQALFKSWFVDFDPVHAKAMGRDFGLPKHLADLFPASFESSGVGEIPKGWSSGRVADLVSLGRELLNPGAFPDETFAHFSIPAFDQGGAPRMEEGRSIKSVKFVVEPGAVLLSKLNPRILRVWLPDLSITTHRAVCSTEFVVALPKTNVSPEFLYCFFGSEAFASTLVTLVTGTSGSHQRVKPESLLAIDTVLPGSQVILAFTKIVRSLLIRVNRTRDESATIKAIRDTLLPKLMSGGLRIRNTGRLVAEIGR